MLKHCLKCGHANPSATGAELESCPQCGAIYSRVEAARLRPGLQIGYATNLHWLFTLRLRQWMGLQGGAVIRHRYP